MSKKTGSKSSNKAQAAKLALPRRRTRMIALEPRMLFDGALALDLTAQATKTDTVGDGAVKSDAGVTPAAPEQPAAPPNVNTSDTGAEKPALEVSKEAAASSHEILFIDGALSHDAIEQIKATARADVEVFVLDPTRDGIEQISEILGAHAEMDAVHIVSHGG